MKTSVVIYPLVCRTEYGDWLPKYLRVEDDGSFITRNTNSKDLPSIKELVSDVAEKVFGERISERYRRAQIKFIQFAETFRGEEFLSMIVFIEENPEAIPGYLVPIERFEEINWGRRGPNSGDLPVIDRNGKVVRIPEKFLASIAKMIQNGIRGPDWSQAAYYD